MLKAAEFWAVARRRASPAARLRPELSGLQHGIACDGQETECGPELIEPTHTLVQSGAKEFPPRFLFSGSRGGCGDVGMFVPQIQGCPVVVHETSVLFESRIESTCLLT